MRPPPYAFGPRGRARGPNEERVGGVRSAQPPLLAVADVDFGSTQVGSLGLVGLLVPVVEGEQVAAAVVVATSVAVVSTWVAVAVTVAVVVAVGAAEVEVGASGVGAGALVVVAGGLLVVDGALVVVDGVLVVVVAGLGATVLAGVVVGALGTAVEAVGLGATGGLGAAGALEAAATAGAAEIGTTLASASGTSPSSTVWITLPPGSSTREGTAAYGTDAAADAAKPRYGAGST